MDWENIFALQISGKKLYPIYVCVCVIAPINNNKTNNPI